MLMRAMRNRTWRSPVHWAAFLLLITVVALPPAGALPARANWPVELDDSCPVLEDGWLVQGSGPEIYLLSQGVLHWIPDLATVSALGYSDDGVVRASEACIALLPVGEPIPSVLPSVAQPPIQISAPRVPVQTSDAPTVRQVPEGTATPTPSSATRLGPIARSGVPTDSALVLSASSTDLSVSSTLTLTARATEPESGPYTLTIQRLRTANGPAGGLVANCAGVPNCAGQTRGSQPADVSYLATLYRCDSNGACKAERSSNSVTVRWR